MKAYSNSALPMTLRDPRYIKIKEAIDNALMRPKNYCTRASLQRFIYSDDKVACIKIQPFTVKFASKLILIFTKIIIPII